ncbi:hypothetical protein B9Z33_08500 [Limnohabitans sp. T6-20]|nr:hypothetical protein B9Z33_08500 [Limnohabitans sp. T6-20]
MVPPADLTKILVKLVPVAAIPPVKVMPCFDPLVLSNVSVALAVLLAKLKLFDKVIVPEPTTSTLVPALIAF